MVATLDIKEDMEVIGADGVFVGIVDKIEGDRIKLNRDDGRGTKRDHHHFLPIALVADIEANKVRLSATAANALMFEEEEGGKPVGAEAANSAKDSAFAFGGEQGDAAATQKAVPIPEVQTTPEAQPAKKASLGTAALGALGAAAVGAAAFGAAKLIKSKEGEALLPLDNDENMRLISSAKVEGTKVVDRDGMTVGAIQSVMIDKYSGRVAYAILSFGGTFGFGATLFPLPWAALDYDTDQDGYVLALTKEQLANAPKFEARDTPEFDAPYRERVVLFYRDA